MGSESCAMVGGECVWVGVLICGFSKFRKTEPPMFQVLKLVIYGNDIALISQSRVRIWLSYPVIGKAIRWKEEILKLLLFSEKNLN